MLKRPAANKSDALAEAAGGADDGPGGGGRTTTVEQKTDGRADALLQARTPFTILLFDIIYYI